MAQAVEQKQLTRDQIPVEDTWDLSSIFANDAEWETELESLDALCDAVAAFRGRLGEGPQVVKEAYDALNKAELTAYRTVVYASLKKDEDTTDNQSQVMFERAYGAAIRNSEKLAFIEPELLGLPAELLASYVNSSELETYHHNLDNLERRRAHVRSAEIEEILVQFADVTRAPSAAFGALDNADLHFGTIVDEEGRTIELTHARYGALMENRNRDVRRNTWETLIGAYSDHGQTLASLYGSSVKKDVVLSRIRGHETVLSEALFDDAIDTSVYTTLVDTIGGGTDEIARYLELRRRTLGVDALHRYDLMVPLSKDVSPTYEYRDAVQIVLDGVGLLGDSYVSDLRGGFESRWVDVHENKGKRSGAYSSGMWGSNPYILMNWNGTLSDVFTLTHEAGHSMHSLYSNRAQPFHLSGYPIFLAEIASTVNEVLLNWHLRSLPEYQNPAEQFSLLNRFADGFIATCVNQTQYAEFEQKAHELAEAGVPLTLEGLNEAWATTLAKYQPGVVIDETTEVAWSRIPHFYRAYYVYQYATGLTAAISIARAIRDEGDAARSRYLTMLSAGGSDYPLNILKAVGVDLTTPQPFQSALAEFADVVTQMTALVDGGLFD